MSDDLLTPLADGAVPPLAPAALVRAAGERRRRRQRVLAGAAALMLVGIGTALAVGASDRGGPDTLDLVAPVATPPTASTSRCRGTDPSAWSPSSGKAR